jgi:hypothetical protein
VLASEMLKFHEKNIAEKNNGQISFPKRREEEEKNKDLNRLLGNKRSYSVKC